MGGGLHPPLSVIASWPAPNYVDPELHSPGYTAFTAVLTVLAVACVAARTWVRAYIQRDAGVDDWLMVAALIPTIGLTAATTLTIERYGFDRHIWDNHPADFIPQRKISLAVQVLFLMASGFIKLSILLFYRRLASRAVSRTFLIVTWISIFSVLGFTIAFLVALFCSCQPFDAYWKQMDLELVATGYKYKCINEPAAVMSTAVISALQDLLATSLPAVLYWRLQMSRRQKTALAAVFALGYIICVVGVLRAYTIYRVYIGSYDVTWEAWYAWLATVLEVCLACICASVPALRIFFAHYFDEIRGTSIRMGYRAAGSKEGRDGTDGRSLAELAKSGSRTPVMDRVSPISGEAHGSRSKDAKSLGRIHVTTDIEVNGFGADWTKNW